MKTGRRVAIILEVTRSQHVPIRPEIRVSKKHQIRWKDRLWHYIKFRVELAFCSCWILLLRENGTHLCSIFYFAKSGDTIPGKKECNFLLTCLPAMHESKCLACGFTAGPLRHSKFDILNSPSPPLPLRPFVATDSPLLCLEHPASRIENRVSSSQFHLTPNCSSCIIYI